MKFTVLGSGTNLVSEGRYASGYLVEHEGYRLLVDCGSHISLRLLQHGLTLRDIDAVVISHRHFDHMGDLPGSVLSMVLEGINWPERARTKPPLELHGYPGFERDYETLANMAYPDRYDRPLIRVHEHGDGHLKLGGLNITTKRVPHMEQFMQAIGFRIDDGKRTVAYSGDTGAADELVQVARSADVALFEAAFPTTALAEFGPRYGHMTPQEAAQMAQKAGVKKLVLTHIYDGLEPEEKIIAAAKEHFDGPVTVAHDGMVL